jgi:hypothetical protein
MRSIHPTLRRGTEMTKSAADEMVNTEVQASPTDILTPQNHRNGGGVIAEQYSNNGWPQQTQNQIVN